MTLKSSMTLLALMGTAVAVTSPVLAQGNPLTPEHLRAQVAGYKATFTCSGTFNGGKSVEQIGREELSGIQRGYREDMATLPAAVIDHEKKQVAVSYSETMPPRYAVWRPHLGCVQLPIGTVDVDGTAALMPQVELPEPQQSNAAWPDGNGGSINAETSAKLQAVLDKAFDAETYGKDTYTTAVLITTPDQILGEQYRDGFNIHTAHRTWSVAKSIGATVVGAAVQEGLVDVKAPATINEWQRPADPRKNITLENLLHMSSGLEHRRAGNSTDDVYFGAGLVSDWVTTRSLEAMPGSRWKYANNDTMLALKAVRDAIGDRTAYNKFAFEKVLYKIGMNDTKLETDWDGNFILSSQVFTTARDLGRLGILYLNDGVWNSERILPDWWNDYVATPAPQQPQRSDMTGYGAQFWLYDKHEQFVPKDTYAARGNRGQTVMIIPSKNIVMVRRGHDESPVASFNMAHFAGDVLKALEE